MSSKAGNKSGGVLVRKSKQVKQSTKTTVHGTSNLLVPHSAECVASAEFMNFAPYPCICCSCLASNAQKKRVYARVYENKLEVNNCPCAPWLCCTPETCINDFIYTNYFSHPPFRIGMCPKPLCCIPCVCCGPPVIYIRRPTTCCCIDLRPCCGETIFASPSNCFDLKCCLCCGLPCHMIWCSRPLVLNARNGRLFLSKLKAATQEYHAQNGFMVPNEASQNVVYREVVDRGDCCCGFCSTTSDVAAWVEPLRAPMSESMDRNVGAATVQTQATGAATTGGGTVVMAAAVQVPVKANNDMPRSFTYDSDDNNLGATPKKSNYTSLNDYDDTDDAFDEMAKRYQPPPEKEVTPAVRQSRTNAKQDNGQQNSIASRSKQARPQNEKGRQSISRSRQSRPSKEKERAPSVNRSRQARPHDEKKKRQSTSRSRDTQHDEKDDLTRRSYTSQLSSGAGAQQQKRTSFDSTWSDGNSSDMSFAQSAHFGASMFHNVALDDSTLDDSGPFSESSSTFEDSGGLGGETSTTMDSSGGLGGNEKTAGEMAKPKRKKRSGNRESSRQSKDGIPVSRHQGGGNRKTGKPREGVERESNKKREEGECASSRPKERGERTSSRPRDGGERASSRPKGTDVRKSSRPREGERKFTKSKDGAGERKTRRPPKEKTGNRASNRQRENRVAQSSRVQQDPEKRRKQPRKSSTRPRPAQYSAGVASNGMERE